MLQLVVEAGRARPDRPHGALVGSWRDDANREFAWAYRTDDGYRLDWSEAGSFAFLPPNPVVSGFAARPDETPAFRHLFHRTIEPILLTAYGFQALHASAAATADGAVVFTGAGGQGKSTFAFALGRRPGCHQVADDAVVLDLRSREPAVHPLPFRSRLRDASRQFLGEVTAEANPSDVAAIHLRAIAILSQDHDATDGCDIERLVSNDAFHALLPHAHRLDRTDRGLTSRFVEDFAKLAAGVATYRVRYSPSFETLGGSLDRVLGAIERN